MVAKRFIWTFLLAVPILVGALQQLPAAFTEPQTVVSLEIAGKDFGTFDEIVGLDSFGPTGEVALRGQHYAKLSLHRSFVTDPSLYEWAKNHRRKKNKLYHMHLVRKSMDGHVLERTVLEYCQPLSWTVEASHPALGGFDETVEIAVRKISQY